MRGRACRSAFTLIEVLIVVVIMAVLAAVIIPQFSSSTEDAKGSALKYNIHTLRQQIELYKAHHTGDYPTVTDGDLPQLTGATDIDGVVGTSDADHPYGPYVVDALPTNPFDGKSNVTAVTLGGVKPTVVADANGGWQYDAATGAIWPNDADGLAEIQ